MTPNPLKRMSLEEYFVFNKNAEGRFEYLDGDVLEMGVTPEHATVEVNLTVILHPAAGAKGCQAFGSSLQVKPRSVLTYRYPDFSVVCGEPVFVEVGGLECLANPKLIVEILSDSTANYDRGEKFLEYKSIESFTEYLLISSTTIGITLIQKHNERFWLQSDYVAGEIFHLNTLDLDIAVDDLYQGIDIATRLPKRKMIEND